MPTIATALRVLALAMVLGLLKLVTAGSDLAAQDDSGWIRPGTALPAQPRQPPVDRRAQPPRQAPAPAAAQPDVEIVARVLVAGDSLVSNLGEGLQSVLADMPEVAVRVEARGPSGLVRDDFFDWPARFEALLADDRDFDIGVVMLGLNDRQTIRVGGEAFAPLSEPWREAYTARIARIASAFAEARVPLIWVGLPPVENPGLSADLARINEWIRDEIRRSGAVHVDIWQGFVDGSDRYSATGPDLSGQTARLRTADGIHFTRAGAEKAAHFVDVELRRLVERPLDRIGIARAAFEAAEDARMRDAAIDAMIRSALGPVPLAPGLDYETRSEPPGPVMPLTRLDLSARGALLSGRPPLDVTSRVVLDRTLREGVAPPPMTGRADDFRWPRTP